MAQRLLPHVDGVSAQPDVLEGELEQFAFLHVGREVPAGLNDIPDLYVQALDRVYRRRRMRMGGGQVKAVRAGTAATSVSTRSKVRRVAATALRSLYSTKTSAPHPVHHAGVHLGLRVTPRERPEKPGRASIRAISMSVLPRLSSTVITQCIKRTPSAYSIQSPSTSR
jgi:hypothetical protein